MLFIFLCLKVDAQKKHFVYFFTDNKQNFSINLHNTNFNSNDNGHLVISRLHNGKYFLTINFPNNKFAEQKFSFVIADNDMGFNLKQSPQGDWALQNIITNDYYAANSSDWEKDKELNDTIHIDKTYVVEKKKESTETKVEPTVTTTTNNTTDSSTKATSTTTVNNSGDENKKTIHRTKERSTTQGITAVYVDYTINPNDTIVLFIPYDDAKPANPTTVDEENTTAKNNDDKTEPQVNSSGDDKSKDYNTACVNLAVEADYLKARKLMSQETSDDKMIKTAIKNFANKCYAVEQIKNLGLLFISDHSRLKFFTAAKPFIYDRLNYASLETQFKLSNIIEQFRQTLF